MLSAKGHGSLSIPGRPGQLDRGLPVAGCLGSILMSFPAFVLFFLPLLAPGKRSAGN